VSPMYWDFTHEKVAPQAGLEPIRLRFATDGLRWVVKLRRDLAEATSPCSFGSSRRTGRL